MGGSVERAGLLVACEYRVRQLTFNHALIVWSRESGIVYKVIGGLTNLF